MAAPWRSLLYRVVDTPFLTVSDDFMLPHMPMNAPGFDRRAPQIFGEWVLSIPTKLVPAPTALDEEYAEVPGTDPDYEAALIRAETRLQLYTQGGAIPEDDFNYSRGVFQYYSPFRYQHYDANSSNIVYYKPLTVKSEFPPDVSRLPSVSQSCPLNPPDTDALCLYAASSGGARADGVPDQPNWVVTDFTDFPGDWTPRRADWPDAVLQKNVNLEEGANPTTRAREKKALEILSEINLTQETEFREFATTPVPFGLWQQKPECHFDSVPKAEEFVEGDKRPLWFDFPDDMPAPEPAAPIFMMSPGAMVYNQICINCHGPRLDSQGRLADNLMLVTGGNTRVANFIHGLLGPVADGDDQTQPGDNRAREFGDEAEAEGRGLVADDLAARYFAWMALGGTRSVIDRGLLGIVLTTDVLGVRRWLSNSIEDANMLEVARLLCEYALGKKEVKLDPYTGKLVFPIGLIGTNGDAETWLKLCSAPMVHRSSAEPNSPPQLRPIRVFVVSTVPPPGAVREFPQHDDVGRPETYPATRAVGDHQGNVRDKLTPDNLFPWCIRPGSDEQVLRMINEINQRRAAMGQPALPLCPQSWFGNSRLGQMVEANRLSDEEQSEWALRGAAAAGLAAFQYITTLAQDLDAEKPVPLLYTQCERLP